jgi:excisionase family DNA binding protein
MQETDSPIVLAEQAPIADLAKGLCLSGEQHPLNPADSSRSKHRPSPDGIASVRVRAMRVNDAAANYGLSRSTLYKLMAPGGGLRSVKIGGRRLIPVDAIEALIAGDGVEPPPRKSAIPSPTLAVEPLAPEAVVKPQSTAKG